jgi:hypothetical protein
MKQAAGVNLIKLFGINLLTLFVAQHRRIMFTLMQWSSIQNSVSKFMPKKLFEIDPSSLFSEKCQLFV